MKRLILIDVVARHFESDYVCAGLELVGKVPLVHAVVTMRPAGRPMAQEMAVEANAIQGSASGAQNHPFLCRRLERRAESDKQVLLRLAAFRPNRLRRDERTGGGREVG